MDFFFKQNLLDSEITEISEFYNSLEYVAIEQNLTWAIKVNGAKNICHFIGKNKDQIVCYSIINEHYRGPFKFATIQFGPIFKDPDYVIEAISEIRKYYKQKKYLYLSIQLPIPTNAVSDYIEYKLNRRFKIRYVFDRNNWSSLTIDLTKSTDEIFKEFSKGHKHAIKKAQKEGLSVKKTDSLEEMHALCEIYIKMNQHRGIPVNQIETKNLFEKVFNFLETEKKGFTMIVKDNTDAIWGGIIAIFQGNSVRYYKGSADPQKRELPILHLALWEAFNMSKKLGFKHFDLWGYNHYAAQNEQVYNINIFKKGFGGTYIFYPKVMHIDLQPFGYAIYKYLRRLHDKLFKQNN